MKELDLNIFPEVSKNEWIDLAKNQLRGDDPIDKLRWTSDLNLDLKPYYDQSDIEDLNDQMSFFKNLEPFYWKLYEIVPVIDELSANNSALSALEGGCDGVIFDIEHQVDFNILLDNILTEICDVSIHSAVVLNDYPESVNGYVIPSTSSAVISSLDKKSQVEGVTHILQNISDEQHILRKASPDFFLEIASIRALRYLLFTHRKIGIDKVQIHTSVDVHPKADHQWFLNSTAGLASILGGTTTINFYTAEGNSRISRNIGNIVREECGIAQYTDQCGGAYYIEALTHKIIGECENNLKS